MNEAKPRIYSFFLINESLHFNIDISEKICGCWSRVLAGWPSIKCAEDRGTLNTVHTIYYSSDNSVSSVRPLHFNPDIRNIIEPANSVQKTTPSGNINNGQQAVHEEGARQKGALHTRHTSTKLMKYDWKKNAKKLPLRRYWWLFPNKCLRMSQNRFYGPADICFLRVIPFL